MAYNHLFRGVSQNPFVSGIIAPVNGVILYLGTIKKDKSFLKILNSKAGGYPYHGAISDDTFIEMVNCDSFPGKAGKIKHFSLGESPNNLTLGLLIDASGDFEKTQETAAEVVADLCLFHKLDTSTVKTIKVVQPKADRESPELIWNQKGFTLQRFLENVDKYKALNGDVLEDMTKVELDNYLADFAESSIRKMVKQEVGRLPVSSKETTYKTLGDVPEYGRATIKSLMGRGLIRTQGTTELGDEIINLTDPIVKVLVILNQAGVF